MQALGYDQGILTLATSGSGSGELPLPQVEVWPTGENGDESTEMVLLSFPTLSGDVEALQKLGNAALMSHPELKKFYVSAMEEAPAKGRSKAASGLLITLEVTNTKGFTPSITPLDGHQLAIALQPNARPGVQNALPVSETPAPTTFSPEDHGRKIKLAGRVSEREMTGKASLLQQQLQETERQRDALDHEVAHLKQALADSQAQQERLEIRMGEYNDILRQYDPSIANPQTRDAVTIHNLRVAVLTLSQKVKMLEPMELSSQTPPSSPKKPPFLPPAVSSASPTAAPLIFYQKSHQSAPVSLKPALSSPGAGLSVAQMAYTLPPRGNEPSSFTEKKPHKALPAIASLQNKPGDALALLSMMETAEKPATGLPVRKQTAPSSTIPAKSSVAPAVKPAATLSKPSLSPLTASTAAPVSGKSLTGKPASQNENKAQVAAKARPMVWKAEDKLRKLKLEAAIREKPTDKKAYLALAELYCRNQADPAAEKTLKSLQKADPKAQEAYTGLVALFLHRKKPDEAQKTLDSYRKMFADPKHPKDHRRFEALQASIIQAKAQLAVQKPVTVWKNTSLVSSNTRPMEKSSAQKPSNAAMKTLSGKPAPASARVPHPSQPPAPQPEESL